MSGLPLGWPCCAAAAIAGVVFGRDVDVVVRDGTTLRVQVVRPEAAGEYPVLLSAQPYGKNQLPVKSRSGPAIPLQYRFAVNDASMTFSAWPALEAPDPAFWVPRGCVLVNLDLRGWGTSGGRPEPFGPHEGKDVHDVVEWAAAQSWSNGKTGMTGVSYLAISQWTGAAQAPPHRAAINPWEGFTGAYPGFRLPGRGAGERIHAGLERLAASAAATLLLVPSRPEAPSAA